MLKVAAYLADRQYHGLEALKSFDICIVTQLALPIVWPSPGGMQAIDVVLIDPNGLDPTRLREFIAECRRHGTGVVIMTELNETHPLELLRRGADTVIPVSEKLDLIACALWTAHNQTLARCELARQLDSLREKTRQRKLIDHAKSIIAEHSNISEAEARRKLRHEARNRRRPMHELAKVVIETHEIIGLKSNIQGGQVPPHPAAIPPSAVHEKSLQTTDHSR